MFQNILVGSKQFVMLAFRNIPYSFASCAPPPHIFANPSDYISILVFRNTPKWLEARGILWVKNEFIEPNSWSSVPDSVTMVVYRAHSDTCSDSDCSRNSSEINFSLWKHSIFAFHCIVIEHLADYSTELTISSVLTIFLLANNCNPLMLSSLLIHILWSTVVQHGLVQYSAVHFSMV